VDAAGSTPTERRGYPPEADRQRDGAQGGAYYTRYFLVGFSRTTGTDNRGRRREKVGRTTDASQRRRYTGGRQATAEERADRAAGRRASDPPLTLILSPLGARRREAGQAEGEQPTARSGGAIRPRRTSLQNGGGEEHERDEGGTKGARGKAATSRRTPNGGKRRGHSGLDDGRRSQTAATKGTT